MTKKELAISYHDKGYNCAQSVVCAFAEELGIDDVTLFKASEGYGLGMGGMQCTCGALSGAIMALGYKNSTANLEGPKSKAATYQITKDVVSMFEEKAGATICKDIKGIETGKVLHSCPACIEDAVEILEKMLQKSLCA